MAAFLNEKLKFNYARNDSKYKPLHNIFINYQALKLTKIGMMPCSYFLIVEFCG